MKKSELKTDRDSQGFYTVYHYARIVWDGFADNANEAKNLAIDYNREVTP